MKKVILSMLLFTVCYSVNAQVTDTGDKVGIGTTNPTKKLDVNGDLKVSGGSTLSGQLYLGTNLSSVIEMKRTGYNYLMATALNGALAFRTGGYSNRFIIDENGNFDFKTGIANFGGDINLNSSYSRVNLNDTDTGQNDWSMINNNGSLTFYDRTAGQHRLFINNNGSVGIGTTNPAASLHVSSPIISKSSTQRIDANLIIEGQSNGRSTDKGASLGFAVPANTDGSNLWQQGRILVTPDNTNNGDANGRMYLQTRYINSQGWVWRDNIVLRSSGNVGIGTESPDAKLAVNGKIHTKEVKVDLLGWSDFVFKKAYQLPTLEEVEKHIKATGHLKDIPSEKEVLKNGILLGEMNAKLLQKIEELTLYTIAQYKKNKEQETQIKKQAKELESLKNLSTRLVKIEKMLENK